MRFAAVLLLLTTTAAAAPVDWGAHFKERYKHATSVKVATSQDELRLGVCGSPIRPRLGFTRITLDFADENLFQDAWIEIAEVDADVVAIAKRKRCAANKRYQVVLQAGTTLVLYHARCSAMGVPFPYDVADLVATIEAAGLTVNERMIRNYCGTFEHEFTTVTAAKKDATKRRKLYKHRFPASRDAAKQ